VSSADTRADVANVRTDGKPAGRERPDPTDLLGIDAMLNEEEPRVRDEVRAFVAERIRPNVAEWWEEAHFPRGIVPEMGALGLLGMHLSGYGCAGRSAVSYGLTCMELEAGDSDV